MQLKKLQMNCFYWIIFLLTTTTVSVYTLFLEINSWQCGLSRRPITIGGLLKNIVYCNQKPDIYWLKYSIQFFSIPLISTDFNLQADQCNQVSTFRNYFIIMYFYLFYSFNRPFLCSPFVYLQFDLKVNNDLFAHLLCLRILTKLPI